MSKNRTDIVYGHSIPQDMLDAWQEFISTYVSPNFGITIVNPTTLRVVAGTDNAQVAVGINGRWRYNAGNADAAMPGGLADGDHPIFVAASDNAFSGGGGGTNETDSTDYTFRLILLAAGSFPTGVGTQALYRQVGFATVKSSAIVSVRSIVGVGLHAATHAPGAVDALPWTVIHGYGTFAARPAAATTNAAYIYFASDTSTLYRSNGTTWDTLSASALTIAGTILLINTFALRPAAASGNANFHYLATDENGGTLYQSNGTTWIQVGLRAGALHPAQTLGLSFAEGVLPGHGTGDVQTDPQQALKVAAPGGSFVLSVQPGYAAIQGDDSAQQGMYEGVLPTAGTVTMATHNPVTNPRIDAIVAEWNDPAFASARVGTDGAGLVFKQVIGTETAGATLTNMNGSPGGAGGPALPPSALILAFVLVLTTDTTGPQAANVKDNRKLAGPAVWGEDGHRYRIGFDATGVFSWEPVF